MKKATRILALALLLAALLSLGFAAGAVRVVESNQCLKVDGALVTVQPFNVDGSNYFKLRDLASLLNGTAAQFSVEYDVSRNAAVIVTGEAYVPVGGELSSVSTANLTAFKSPQTIVINGATVTDLSVYNIGGNNYFKLRDLGAALGFAVDYDELSRTMLISTGWAPELFFTTTDGEGNTWTDACFARNKVTMLNLWAYWCGPCVGELPDLQRLSEDYADKGLQILGVTNEGDFDLSVKKMAELGVTYPCLVNAGDLVEALFSGYVPTTLFVDQNGHVLDEAYIGSRDYDTWARIIEGYLG